MGTLRFLLRRCVAQRLLGLAVVVTLAFSIGVMVAGPIYADAAREAILSSTLSGGGVASVNTRFVVSGGPAFDHEAADAAIRSAVGGLPLVAIVEQGRGPILIGSEGGPAPSYQTNAIFRVGAETHLPNFRGEAPGDGEVALTDTLARRFGVAIGDRIVTAGTAGQPMPLTVSATFPTPPPGDPFWYGSRSPFPEPVRERQTPTIVGEPILLGRDGYLDAVEKLGITSEFVWDAYLDVGAITFDRAVGLPAEIRSLAARLQDTAATSGLRFGNGLDTLIEVVRQRVATLSVPILLVVFQISAVTLAVLAGVGSLVLTRQSFELAVLRSRGFSRRALLLAQSVQAVLAATLAYPLGLVLGAGLALLASRSNGRSLPGTLFPIRLSAGAAVLGLGVAVIGALILLVLSIPYVRRTVLEERRSLSRAEGPPLARLPVELFVAPVAIFAFVQLRNVSGGRPAADSLDPLVLLAPTLLIVAASFFVMRLLLLALRATDRAIGRSRRLSRYLAFRRLGRAPGVGFAAALLLLLSVGLLVVSTSYRAVVVRSHDDSAHQQVGGDWNIQVTPPEQALAAVASMPTGTTPVIRTEPRFEEAGLPSTPVAIAIDPDSYESGGWWRADYGERSLREILDALRAEPFGLALPPGARELEVTVDAPPEVAGLQLAATVEAADRSATTAEAGKPVHEGTTIYRIPVAGGERLLSLSLLTSIGTDLPFEFSIDVRDLSVDGRPLPLDAFEPMTWRGSSGELSGTSLRITRGSGEVVGGLIPSAPPLPTLVSSNASAALGDRFHMTLGAQQFVAARAAVATTFPTVLPTQAFVVVSAPALLERAAAIPEAGLTLNEVLATGDADPRPELQRSGFRTGAVQRTAPIEDTLAQLPQSLAVGLQFAVAVGGLGLVVIGVAVALSVAQRRRDFEFAAMRAMGAEPRDLALALLWEQGVLLGFAIVAGLTIGEAVLRLMIPYIGRDLGVPFPAPVLVLDTAALALSVAAIAIATLVGLILSIRALMRSSVTGVLRGEPE
jgi:putative ABC transport system permease protein